MAKFIKGLYMLRCTSSVQECVTVCPLRSYLDKWVFREFCKIQCYFSFVIKTTQKGGTKAMSTGTLLAWKKRNDLCGGWWARLLNLSITCVCTLWSQGFSRIHLNCSHYYDKFSQEFLKIIMQENKG